MKKFIIKSNEWANKQEFITIITIILITLFTLILTSVRGWWWTYVTWVVLYSFWRISYVIITERNIDNENK
jgi:hypothetical protein